MKKLCIAVLALSLLSGSAAVAQYNPDHDQGAVQNDQHKRVMSARDTGHQVQSQHRHKVCTTRHHRRSCR
jgi:hypothetical protein